MGFGDFFRKLRGDQRAMPDPNSPEFDQAVQGSALPGSAQMNEDGWVSAAEASAGGIAGGLTQTSVEVSGQPPGQVQGAVTAESLIAAGVPAEQAQQVAQSITQLQQAFGGAGFGGAMASADVSVSAGQAQTLDLRGMQGLRDEMMGVMRQYGVDPESGQPFDASQVPGLQEALMQVLASRGVDISQFGGQEGGQSGGTPSGFSFDAGGFPGGNA